MTDLLDAALATAWTPGYRSSLGWEPRILDAVLIEWLIVVCYFATAVLCLRARRVAAIGAETARAYALPERRSRDRRASYDLSAAFWMILFVGMVALGINKHFDLHWELTKLLRWLSHAQGWYSIRRSVQGTLLVTAVVVGSVGLGALIWAARRDVPRLAPAFVGALLLGLFLLTKMSSFHHIDALFAVRIMGVDVQHPLELAGILLVAVCALMNCWWLDVRRALDSIRERFGLAPSPAGV